MALIARSSSPSVDTRMASSSMSRRDTSTGPTWETPLPTTAPSSELTSTGRIARRSFPRAAHSLPSNCSSKRRAESCTGDREGMRLMRANLDGSDIETLVDASKGDPRPGPDPAKWCVGVAIDVDAGKVYWTQKGGDNAGEGRILRANLDMPRGQTPTNRTDIELLYDRLPEPIDLDLDLESRLLYW